MKKIILLILLGFVFIFLPFIIKANIDDDLNTINKELVELRADLQKKETNFQKLNLKLENIKLRLSYLETDIKKKEAEIKKGEAVLAYQKNLLNERARSYYKNINKSSFSLINLLVANNLSQSLENFFYQKSLVDEDKKTIIKIVFYIKNLEEARAKLKEEKSNLAVLKEEADQQSKILAGEISSTKKRVAELSAKQQQLIAQKLASLNISRSAGSIGRCDSDLTNGRDPGFGPRFAFFTYGVPNRVGLNQWGAKARADSGQNEEEILRAYYENFELKKDYNQEITINVEGHASYKIEDYLKHIFEMPGGWNIAALKAQVIAARSYALSYTNNGQSSICATEQCQVFHDEEKGGLWNEAVEATKGWVMVQGGSPIKAWYSSTHGGYIFNSGEIGWLGTSWTKHAIDSRGTINNFGDLQNNAYDKDSPWFYCDWGWRTEYNKTAWLRPGEIADIVNVVLLAKADLSTREHLYQPDKPNPAGTETWDQEKVKSELRSRGSSPYNNIFEISISADFSGGRSTSVAVSGDAGSITIDAGEFKNWFNLRAPANIQIVGPLYNVEKR